MMGIKIVFDSMKIQKLAILLLILISTPLYAGQQNITGNVLSDSGTPLGGVEILINDTRISSNELGQFSVSVPSADLYVLRFSAKDHFPMIHSFSAKTEAEVVEPTEIHSPLFLFNHGTMLNRN